MHMTRRRRDGFAGAFLALAVSSLAVASVAWACVPSGFHGQGSIDGVKTAPNGLEAGPRGSTVVISGWQLKSRMPLTAPNEPLAAPATYRIQFLDSARVVADGDCLTEGFVMKRTDGTRANAVAAPGNGDADVNGHDGAFSVDLRVPTYLPGTTTKVATGKSKICGLEQAPDLNHTALRHFTFKVTAV